MSTAEQAVGRATTKSRDLIVLGLLAAIALLPHLASLGFYSDDWNFLGRLVLASSQRLPDLLHALHQQMRMRPGQLVYLVALYQLFGLEPVGYHLANAAVLTATALVFSLVLRRIGASRSVSLATPLLFVVLPHYSTARIWYASFQAPLSVLLYLTSLLAGLRSLDGSARRSVLWQAMSLAALAASTLSYEVCVLLFPLNAVLYAKRAQGQAHARGLVLAGLTLAATFAVILFKMLTATKVVASPHAGYPLYLIRQVLWIDGVVYGLALPRTLLRAARLAGSFDFVVAIFLTVAVIWYLRTIAGEEARTAWRSWDIVVKGVLVAAFGVALFFITPVSFHSTGAANRIAIASAVGVAMVIIGLIASATIRLAPAVRSWIFALASGGLIGTSALISGAIGNQWVQASSRAQGVLEKFTAILPTVRPSTTLLLLGTCPYVGPAVVFQSPWDLRGALWLRYRDTTLKADIVTASTRLGGDGVHTKMFGAERIYPYPSLLLVNLGRGTARPLPDSASAADSLRIWKAEATACPFGHEGYGVGIF